jgi:hypothetical protein
MFNPGLSKRMSWRFYVDIGVVREGVRRVICLTSYFVKEDVMTILCWHRCCKGGCQEGYMSNLLFCKGGCHDDSMLTSVNIEPSWHPFWQTWVKHITVMASYLKQPGTRHGRIHDMLLSRTTGYICYARYIYMELLWHPPLQSRRSDMNPSLSSYFVKEDFMTILCWHRCCKGGCQEGYMSNLLFCKGGFHASFTK